MLTFCFSFGCRMLRVSDSSRRVILPECDPVATNFPRSCILTECSESSHTCMGIGTQGHAFEEVLEPRAIALKMSSYLYGEGGSGLLEEDVPHIQSTTHGGGEEHRGARGTPATICQVVVAVPACREEKLEDGTYNSPRHPKGCLEEHTNLRSPHDGRLLCVF